MPYINFENRAALDTIIDGLLSRLASIKCGKGDVNYCITRIILEALKPADGWTYHSLSDCVSVARDAADEIQRRLLGPYEDKAIRKNGDILCLSEIFSSCGASKEIKEREVSCRCKHKEELDKYQGNHPRTLKEATEELSEELLRHIDECRGGF